ncbi:N-methyltransferase tcpN [Paramyrothecium foliicola]|nr:N-methyltransferase tcpN [Paramyrothecium foliicola]
MGLNNMTSTTTQDTYRGPRSQVEYDRLAIQHELVRTAMNGKLLYSDVDYNKPDLRVLDSATAAGTWLIDLASRVPSTAQLFGTDLAPQHFVPAEKRPKNVNLSTHSIFEPWPAEFLESFDIVHQRFVLTVASNVTGQEAVKLLFQCVKPGGVIELHEGNMLSIQEGPEHKAFVKFRDVMVNAWAAIGNQPSPGSYLVPWLKEAGAIDIQEEVQPIKVGAAADDKEQGERAVIVLLQLLDGMKKMLGGKPNQPTNEEFDVLRKDLETELRTVGNIYYYHLTWARKAAA